jgi:hypothetical protein
VWKTEEYIPMGAALLPKCGNIKPEMLDDRYEKGFLVPWLGCAMACLMCILPMGWIERFKKLSAVATEVYVLCWLGIAVTISAALWCCYGYVSAVEWLVYLLALLRVLEIIVRTTTVNFSNVISRPRSLVLLAINYVELMVWFGLVYALNSQSLVDQSLSDHGAPASPITAFYFSVITQLTIGYGDVYATGGLRTIAALQGLVGALFVIVVLGRALSSK